MAGNVWEWVLDDFDHQHLAWKSTSCPRDPVAQREGAEKVMRGGSFMCHKSYCWRSAARPLAIPAVAAHTPPRSPFFTVPPAATTSTQSELAVRPSQLSEPLLPTTYLTRRVPQCCAVSRLSGLLSGSPRLSLCSHRSTPRPNPSHAHVHAWTHMRHSLVHCGLHGRTHVAFLHAPRHKQARPQAQTSHAVQRTHALRTLLA